MPLIAPPVVLDAPHWAQLESVQVEVNRQVTYVSDQQKFGKDDYWEPADSTGDCEDIALAKRKRLEALGWPADALRIAVVADEKGRLHAVLTVDVVDAKGRAATYAMDSRLLHVEPWQNLSALGYRWIERARPGSGDRWSRLG